MSVLQFEDSMYDTSLAYDTIGTPTVSDKEQRDVRQEREKLMESHLAGMHKGTQEKAMRDKEICVECREKIDGHKYTSVLVKGLIIGDEYYGAHCFKCRYEYDCGGY